MNAYELAEIMEVHDGSQVWEHGLEIANMLRQQADRIAELEKELQEFAMYNISVTSQADEHYARVQELEKQVSGYQAATKHYREKSEKQSEPVAWVCDAFHVDFEEQGWAIITPTKDKSAFIPLYTTPQTKPLSDREHNVMQKALIRSGKLVTPQTKPLSDEEIKVIGKEIWDVGSLSYEDIAFARAIEAKVRGEK
jgi:glucan-binding YG repeat protein